MSREEHETVISEVAGRSSKKLKGVGTRAGWSQNGRVPTEKEHAVDIRREKGHPISSNLSEEIGSFHFYCILFIQVQILETSTYFILL